MKFKNTLISIAKSSLIGIACIVPGVSGGTLAVILGLYDKILYSVSNLRKEFKKSFMFLWPIILGIAIGLGAMIYPIKLAFEHFPLPTILFFVGLILGSLPSLSKNIRRRPNISGSISMALAVVAVIGLCFIGAGTDANLTSTMPWYNYLIVALVGILGSCALTIPGISGSALLLIIGFWNPILTCVTDIFKFIDLGHNILVLLCFAVGIVIGFILISKLMTFLLERFHYQTYMAIIGFIVASIFALFYQIHDNMIPEGIVAVVIIVGVILFILGLVASFFLAHISSKTNNVEQSEESKEENKNA